MTSKAGFMKPAPGDECALAWWPTSRGVVGLNLVLSDKVFSLLILVAWGMVNKNQEGLR